MPGRFGAGHQRAGCRLQIGDAALGGASGTISFPRRFLAGMFVAGLKIMTLEGQCSRWRRFLAVLGCALLGWCSRAETTNLNRFGFTGPEIFPIDNQLSQLRVADLDGDGLNDLIVVNNFHMAGIGDDAIEQLRSELLAAS